MNSSTVAARVIDSPVGPLTLRATDTHLVGVAFGGSTTPDTDGHLPGAGTILGEAAGQLSEYFGGTRTQFDLPVELDGTPFQMSAWKALLEAPFGATMTYSQQARIIGRPTATRAVGAANGRNPVAIVLPCHRVVGSNGSLTGFAGGVDVKRWLLDHEQGVLAARHAPREAS